MVQPVLDGFDLPLVQRIEGVETEVLAEHAVPALEGDFLQDLGRRAARFDLNGALTGTTAADTLKTLRQKHRDAAPVPFVADIATATRVSQVVIEELTIREIAGRPERFEYAMKLVEFIPAPPPQHEEPVKPPPPPPDTKNGVLEVQVIVDNDPQFDFTKVTVSATGERDDGKPFSKATLPGPTQTNIWTQKPTPPGSYTAVATVDDPPLSGSASGKVTAGQTTRLIIHLQLGPPVAHGFVVHYWFDKALIEPCLRRVMRDVAAYADAHPDERVLIVGNTDLVGGDDYNQSLSERRARGVFAYLTAGGAHDVSVSEWNNLRKAGSATTRLEDNWRVREYQQLLSGLGFYVGAIDEVHGPLTDAAVRNFQTDHGLPVDGVVGDGTWLAMIDDYLSADGLSIAESRFFPNCPPEVVKWLGSGEQEPVRNTEDAWRPNRRTDIVFMKADALPGKVAPPVTFDLPPPGGFVNSKWCVGAQGDPRVVLSHTAPREGAFFVQPAEPGSFIVKGTMTFEDGTPAAGVGYVLTAPDGEYLDGERPAGPDRGRPIPGATAADGSFPGTAKTKGVGVYVLAVDGKFTVRLKSAAANSGTTPILCAKLDGSANLDVVLAPADGVDPRRKLIATVFDRSFQPLVAHKVLVQLPDASTADATTDANGRFSVVMADALPTAQLRYAASADPTDEVLFRDYFVAVGDIGTDDGVTRRLHNLGFVTDNLAAAFGKFQELSDLPVTGVLDDATRTRLDRVYNGDQPIVTMPTDSGGVIGPLIGDGPPEPEPSVLGHTDDAAIADPLGAHA